MAKMRKIELSFYNTRDKFVQDGVLFEDSEFAVDTTQLSCVWRRPRETHDLPVFNDSAKNTEQGSIVKGKMTSDAFVFAVDILRESELINYVVAQNQSFSSDYAGMFLFRFWRSGRPIGVVIDDQLPYDSSTQKPLSSYLSNSQNIWCPLLEKAYAKFLGGYAQLEQVCIRRAMTDIVGCCVTAFPLNPINKPFFALFDVINRDAIALAELPKNHSLPTRFGVPREQKIVRLKSMTRSSNEKRKCEWVLKLSNINDNESGNSKSDLDSDVPLQDFVKVCSVLYICLIRFAGLLSSPPSSRWETQIITGSYDQCQLRKTKAHHHPIIRILITKDDKGGTSGLCSVILSLLQSKHFVSSAEQIKIGVTIMGLKGNENSMNKISKKALALSPPVFTTPLSAQPEISVYLLLSVGQYLIIPEIEGPSVSSPYAYFITLFSLSTISILNGGFQNYGRGFLAPVQFEVSAPNHVVIGDPIEIVCKIAEFPPQTRFTITLKLSFGRSSSVTPIKVRIEYIEVCHRLLDKTLIMTVWCHEYIKFPLKSELFMIRCSAFIHELNLEVNCHREIRTILPKIYMTIDSKVYTNRMCLLTAKLFNSLPFSLQSSSFEVSCATNWGSLISPTVDIPPYALFWYFCLLKSPKSGTRSVKLLFSSSLFKRSVAADISIVDSTSITTIPSLTQTKGSSFSFPELFASCCSNHKAVFGRNSQADKLWLEVAGKNEVKRESSSCMMYCTPTRDSSPEISEETTEYND